MISFLFFTFLLLFFTLLIFTSPFSFSVEISVFIFYFSVIVFNQNQNRQSRPSCFNCWTINMVDQGVHPAECGFVDDVSPGKFSNFTSIDRSKSKTVFPFNVPFNASI